MALRLRRRSALAVDEAGDDVEDEVAQPVGQDALVRSGVVQVEDDDREDDRE